MPRGKKFVLGEISAPEDRVLRVTNFHWDATNADVNDFFDGYGLVDWKRSKNVKSGKSTVAYILLSTLDHIVRAIEELNLKQLLGRHIRIMRAKGGFQLTASGLLNLTDSEHAANFDRHTESHAFTNRLDKVTHSHDLSFPPLTRTPKFESENRSFYTLLRRPAIKPPALLSSEERTSTTMLWSRRHRLQPVPDGPVHRVLLISRLHPDANRNAVELFFQGFRIVDYKRKFNERLRKYNTTAFVLFESVQERDRARIMKHGQKILGREVCLDVATRGIRVSNDGFLPDDPADSVSPLWSQLTPANYRNSDNPSTSVRMSTTSRRSEGHHTPVPTRTIGLGLNTIRRASSDAQTRLQSVTEESSQEDQSTDVAQNMSSRNQPPRTLQDSLRVENNRRSNREFLFRNPWTETHSPINSKVASSQGLGPWNLAGNNNEDKQYNVIVEEEWYGFW